LDILKSLEKADEPCNAVKKKEKLQLKREAFVDSKWLFHSIIDYYGLMIPLRAAVFPFAILEEPKTTTQKEAKGTSWRRP
jgi:hypothetical protein